MIQSTDMAENDDRRTREQVLADHRKQLQEFVRIQHDACVAASRQRYDRFIRATKQPNPKEGKHNGRE